jgi:hypothetical protein
MPREVRPFRVDTDFRGRPIRATAPVQAAVATVEDVRRAYYDASSTPMSWWITEVQLDPAQLIVCDEATANVYRVPVTINGSAVSFGDPVPVERVFTDMPASGKTAAARWGSPVAARAGRPAAPGARPARGTEEKIAAAIAAGKIPQSRAAFYRQMAAQGDDLSVLDTLAGCPGLTTASAPQDPAMAAYQNLFGDTPDDGPQAVSAAAQPTDADLYQTIYPTPDQARAAIDAREAAKARAVAAMTDDELWTEMGFDRKRPK